MADFKDRKGMTSRTGIWLEDHPTSGAKGAKEDSRHSPEVARAMDKRKKAVDKKRAEKQKKLFEGKVKVG